MAIATPESYNAMLDAAKAGGYAFPAVNITSSSTVTAAIQGFAEAESDGIIQVSIGGAQYASGSTIKDKVTGKGGAYFYEVTHKSHPPGSNSFVLHTKSTKVYKKS